MRLRVLKAITVLVIIGGYRVMVWAATVTLWPGNSNNLQTAVSNNPPGTTFILQHGTYRGASVTSLKDGDSFIGQGFVDLNGSNILKGWKTVSIGGVEYWTTAGGTPLPTPACPVHSGICCEPNYPGCIYVQDLYVNNVEYQHVTSLTNVASGTWYYDYDGTDGGIQNNIYMYPGDAPNTNFVELGATNYAFIGAASNITIQNLTIEKYAPPLQMGAVTAAGPDWVIQNNQVKLNHGEGIKAVPGGDNVQVLGNNVHDNGEAGIGAGSINGGLFDSNYIVHNNVDQVLRGFEGVGTKFTGDNLTISNNIVHDNLGNGLSTDSNASYETYIHNTSYNNMGCGIVYETSRYGTIEDNTVYGNTTCGGIIYAGSDHGRITGNTVTDDGVGGIKVYNIVGTRALQATYQVTDTQVTGNTIAIASIPGDIASGLIDTANPPEPNVFTDPTNIWANNTYLVPTLPWTKKSWAWGENNGLVNPIDWNVP